MGLLPVSCHAGPQSTIGTRSAVAGPAGGVKKDGEVSPEPFPLSGQDSIGASWCAKLIQQDRCGFEYPRWPRSKMSGLRIPAGAAGVPARISVRSRDAMFPGSEQRSRGSAALRPRTGWGTADLVAETPRDQVGDQCRRNEPGEQPERRIPVIL